MKELIQRYEDNIERLFKAEEWLESKGCNSWEEIRKTHPKRYKSRNDLIKEIEHIQKDIHSHMATS